MKISQIRSRCIVLIRSALLFIYSRRLNRIPKLRALLDSFKSSESSAVDTADALAIYETVSRLKPQNILELGPGTSSAVIALAISELQQIDPTYKPRFVAIEENPEWLKYHESKFPVNLRDKVEMIHRTSDGKELYGIKVVYYRDIPDLPYDFIHVDGPDLLIRGAAVGSDLVDLAPSLADNCYVIFDGRQASARFAIKHLPKVIAKHHPYSLNFEIQLPK